MQIDYNGGNLKYKNFKKLSEWTSLQFHFHAPSEHLIDGRRFDAEMHMVFEGKTFRKELAVIGLLFESCETAETDKFIESLQLDKLDYPQSENNDLSVSLTSLYGNLESYENYNYQGSLTTPGYDENVLWFVFTKPVKVPPRQIESMARLWNKERYPQCIAGNARDICEIGSRTVHLIKHTHESR